MVQYTGQNRPHEQTSQILQPLTMDKRRTECHARLDCFRERENRSFVAMAQGSDPRKTSKPKVLLTLHATSHPLSPWNFSIDNPLANFRESHFGLLLPILSFSRSLRTFFANSAPLRLHHEFIGIRPKGEGQPLPNSRLMSPFFFHFIVVARVF